MQPVLNTLHRVSLCYSYCSTHPTWPQQILHYVPLSIFHPTGGGPIVQFGKFENTNSLDQWNSRGLPWLIAITESRVRTAWSCSLHANRWFLCSAQRLVWMKLHIHPEKKPYYLQLISSLNLPNPYAIAVIRLTLPLPMLISVTAAPHDWSIVHSRASLTCLGRKKFRASPAQCGPSSRTSARFNTSQPWLWPRNACRHIYTNLRARSACS
jgi:hypothetical protein